MVCTRSSIPHVKAAPTLLALSFLCSGSAEAYIGPGAGFAFVSSFFILFLTFASVFLILLTWPLRWLIRLLFARKPPAKGRTKRVIVLGLDGQDPDLTRQWMEEGLLPNFSNLAEEGSFSNLATTLLAESPVAWSSFSTGCNPGKHGIYDFLVPNRKTHLPELSSAKVDPPSRSIPLGKYRIPIGKPRIQIGRKSKCFWNVLGEHNLFSSILRVPITFPPEKFRGVLLSAMCLPDLRGSQGTFFYFTSDPDDNQELSGGERIPIEVADGVARSSIPGPENSLLAKGGEMSVPLEVRLGKDSSNCELLIGKKTYPLRMGEYTPYIRIEFRPGLGMKVSGLVRFRLLEVSPHFRLYMTPLNIDPSKPALPISYPFTYSGYLANTQGLYSTLGLAEDTNALKAGVIDEDAFLEQTYDIHSEREKMFFDALEKTRRGLVVCVFDITDRLQHMFFRYLDEYHPGNKGRENTKHKDAIKKLYIQMDGLVGKVRKKMAKDDVLFVMSDHGFKSFQRTVNLNTWLFENGYLALEGDRPTGKDYFSEVDWTKTKAYAMGFGGIYLNLKGREAKGIVGRNGEAGSVKEEIASQLRKLQDTERDAEPIREVYDASQVYSGPYVDRAPDLCVGFRVGYRASILNVTGGVAENIFEDNENDWSGDHNFNPPDVPGMMCTNRKVTADDPRIIDIGPTILDLFGVQIPSYMDGRSLMPLADQEEVS